MLGAELYLASPAARPLRHLAATCAVAGKQRPSPAPAPAGGAWAWCRRKTAERAETDTWRLSAPPLRCRPCYLFSLFERPPICALPPARLTSLPSAFVAGADYAGNSVPWLLPPLLHACWFATWLRPPSPLLLFFRVSRAAGCCCCCCCCCCCPTPANAGLLCYGASPGPLWEDRCERARGRRSAPVRAQQSAEIRCARVSSVRALLR
jgi:hypothetical protein